MLVGLRNSELDYKLGQLRLKKLSIEDCTIQADLETAKEKDWNGAI